MRPDTFIWEAPFFSVIINRRKLKVIAINPVAKGSPAEHLTIDQAVSLADAIYSAVKKLGELEREEQTSAG